MLADEAVVESLDTEIVQNLENEGKIEQGEIQAVIGPYPVLHREVDAEDKKGLNQYIDKDQEQDVEDEFAFHAVKVNGSPMICTKVCYGFPNP